MGAMASGVIERLRAQIQCLEYAGFEREQRCVSSLLPHVDAALPQKGIVLGSFIELLEDSPGLGSYSLALKLAKGASEARLLWAVLDTQGTLNPPVAEALGWDLRHLIVVRSQPKDGGWCFSQLLRSPDFGTCFWLTDNLDNMVFRRLQLAAERGGGVGWVIRPLAALRKPCWGSLRLQVLARSNDKVHVRLLHARGQPRVTNDEFEVEL
jgi:protein ImuA